MGEGDELRILLDQVTEGQVSWSPLDRDFDRVRLLCARNVYIGSKVGTVLPGFK